MPSWAAVPLEELPRAAANKAGAAWYPLQHLFGFTAFGANALVAERAGDALIEEHDETRSGQEELYLVVRGRAEFSIGGETVHAPAITAVAVRDPSVTRRAIATEPGTTLLAFGGLPSEDFRSTWLPGHFEGVPRLLPSSHQT